MDFSNLNRSETIPDIDQRTRAIRPDQSFIVQAPAGSGKTELLIQRYLGLLAKVDAPEEIVAITFTKKASAEMLGRILKALNDAQSDQQVAKPHEQLTRHLASAALAQGQSLGWDILENPGRLRIQTIDSLCASLNRQMPIMSGLGGQPDITDDPAPLYMQAAAETLYELESGNEWSPSIARLLIHLDNDLPHLQTLLADMLQKRDQWLRYVLLEHDRKDLEQALVNLVQEKLADLAQLFPQQKADELCELLRYAAENLRQIDKPGPVTTCLDMHKMPGYDAGDMPQWLGIVELLLTKEGTWRARVDKNTGFPSASDNKLDSEKRNSMKQALTGLITQLREIDGLDLALAELRQLPPPRFTDEEWELVNALYELLKLSAAQLQLLFSERNLMDFAGVAQAAITALGNEDTPTDLALYLDYQIKHLLVDEFQDTSVNQLELLQRLTAQWSEQDGRTLFLVGDPMQSIYRFREAEVSNFIQTFHQQQLGQIRLQPLILTVNFRSEQGIVNWVNQSFARIFPKADEMTTGAVSFHPSTAIHDNTVTSNINICPFFDDSAELEAANIAELVGTVRVKSPSDSIAILVRNKSHLAAIIPALRKAGHRFRAIEIESLGDRPAIQDMLALTRAWLHLADRSAWLSILRAPWCGLDLKALLTLTNNDKRRTIWECCQDESILQQLEPESRQRLQRVVTLFEQAFGQRHRQSVRTTIESLWCQLGGPATLTDMNDLENINTCLELLASLDVGGDIEDLQLLLDEVAGLFAVPDKQTDEHSLQIMTIHKAKGLEFDHVIVPALGRLSGRTGTELLKWMLRPREHGGHDLLFGVIRETGANTSPIYQYIQNVEKRKNTHESIRLLYVAATRTRKSLYLSGSVALKTNKEGVRRCSVTGGSLLQLLWPILQDSWETAMPSADTILTEQGSIKVNHGIRRLMRDWALPEPPQAVSREIPQIEVSAEEHKRQIEYLWAGETIRHIGSIVHRCIQWIAGDGIEYWDADKVHAKRDYFILMFKQAGVPEEEIEQAYQQVETALVQMLADTRGRWILSNDHTDQKNEYALTGIYESRLINVIIDRTFVDDEGTRWIVDYKTSRHEGTGLQAFLEREQQRYASQMHKYATLMQGLDKKPIRLGLYFPLLQAWREWEY